MKTSTKQKALKKKMLPTVLFQRNVVLNSNLLEKWLQLGNLFSKFAAAFKIIGPKPASNGSVRRIKFNCRDSEIMKPLTCIH